LFIDFFELDKQIEILEEISIICIDANNTDCLKKILSHVEKYSNFYKTQILSFILLKISDKVFQFNNYQANDIFINIIKKYMFFLNKKYKDIIAQKICLYYKNNKDLKSDVKWFKNVLDIDKSNKYAIEGLIESLTNYGRYIEAFGYINNLNKKEKIDSAYNISAKCIKEEDIDSLRCIIGNSKNLTNGMDIISAIFHMCADKMYKCKKSGTEKKLAELLKKYLNFANKSIRGKIAEKISHYYACKKKTSESLEWLSLIDSDFKITKNSNITKTINTLEYINIKKTEEFIRRLNKIHSKFLNSKIKKIINEYLVRLKYKVVKDKIRELITLKKYDKALNFVKKIKECKKDVVYMLETGQLLKTASDYSGAIKWFKQVLKADVKNKYAVRGLVESLINARRYSELRKYIKYLNKKERFIIMNKTVEKYIDSEDIDSLKRILKHNKILTNNKNILSATLCMVGDKMYKCKKHDTERKLTELLKKYVKFLPDSLKIKVSLYYSENKNVKETIRWLSYIRSNLINQKKIISLIVNMLRNEVILKNDVKNIIKNLNILHKNIKDVKFKNLILGETEILQNKIILKSKPIKMHVVLTTKCNLKCIMCNVCTNEYTISNNYIKIIKEYLPYLEEISWQGGELFLYDKFEELIKLAAKYKVEQEFVTNGLLLDKRRIEIIAKYNIFLSISIDSVKKETYEYIRAGAKFDSLIFVLKQLYDYKLNHSDIKYSMSVVVMSINYKELDDIVKFAILYGFTGIYFQRYIPHENITDDLMLNEEQSLHVFEKIQEIKNKFTNMIIKTNIGDDVFKYWNVKKINSDSDILHKDETNQLPGSSDNNNYEKKDNEFSQSQNNNIYEKIFCIAPWKTLFLDFGMKMKFSGYCNSFKTLDGEYDIWNCRPAVEYRRSIIKNKILDYCNRFCKTAGNDGEEVRKFGRS